nr:hypothetical protein [uncultured Steroidobacter sp.]
MPNLNPAPYAASMQLCGSDSRPIAIAIAIAIATIAIEQVDATLILCVLEKPGQRFEVLSHSAA